MSRVRARTARAGYAGIIAQPTPQTERADPRQVPNSAGGFGFALDDFGRLERFLIIGSDAPTYYASARKLTLENVACVDRCLVADARRTVEAVVDVSTKGRAPKNDPAIFALALAAESDDANTRALALAALGIVCRTGTHLFQFLEFKKAVAASRGRKHMRRSHALHRAIERWFNLRPVDKAALQLIKYRQRAGWSQADVLKLVHPRPARAVDAGDATALRSRVALYQWGAGFGTAKRTEAEEARIARSVETRNSVPYDPARLPLVVRMHLMAMGAKTEGDVAKIAREGLLPWEAIPTDFATKPSVREALLPKMGLTAMIRQLGAMTADGVLAPLNKNVDVVLSKLANLDEVRRSRIHPFNALLARTVYAGGRTVSAHERGREGKTWMAVPAIIDALEDVFYASFANVVPTGKRTLVGLDVSASMTSQMLLGTVMSAHEAAAAMSMVFLRTEKRSHVMMFDNGIRDLRLTARSSLDEVKSKTDSINGGGTDCALPMLWASDEKIEVDTFVVITDNETHSGRRGHPHQALQAYRQQTGIDAKLVVVGMTSTGFTIANPSDRGMLDVVGFDSAAPAVIADFARGDAPDVGPASSVPEDYMSDGPWEAVG